MIIHVVKQGETVNSIAEFYGKSVKRLILENGISDANNLAIGETLVILYPEIEYTIQEGDTLESIARNHNTTIMELLRNNPFLSDRQFIYPGESIVISYRGEKIRRISTNGYVYPFTNIRTLKKTLPFLTYLTVFSYFYTDQGEIFDIDDIEVIQMSRAYGVAPIMMLTGYSSSQAEEIEVIHSILNDELLQDSLINNLIRVMSKKGYSGVDFKTPYIRPEDRHLFAPFIQKFSSLLHSAGFKVFISLTISVFEALSNIKYDELDYYSLGQSVDNIIIISYEFGFAFGISPIVIPYDTINNIYEYLSNLIPSNKIVAGLSTIGYIWKLPYVDEVTRGQSMSYNSAIALARELDVEIQYDEISKAAYFQFISEFEYIVRFRDARGVDAIVGLVPTHNLNGVSIWNVMFFYNQMWLIINSQYEIEKVVPLMSSAKGCPEN